MVLDALPQDIDACSVAITVFVQAHHDLALPGASITTIKLLVTKASCTCSTLRYLSNWWAMLATAVLQLNVL